MSRPAAQYDNDLESSDKHGAKPKPAGAKEERLCRVVRQALDRVPHGKRIADYFFRGGQSFSEAAGTRMGLEMLMDPVMAAKGAEKLRRIADNSPLDPDLLRNLMRLSKK